MMRRWFRSCRKGRNANGSIDISSSSSSSPAVEQSPLLEMHQSRMDKDSPFKPQPSLSTMDSLSSSFLDWLLQVLRLDRDPFQFAFRMAVVLTFSSLFVLLRTSDHLSFPNGMWVYVTVLNVSWFPTLRDAASVFEKTMQRWLGTMLGAILGLSCGFLSLALTGRPQQATFLGICMFVVSFGVVAIAGQIKYGNQKLIQKVSYATCLCLLTLGVAMLPFSNETEDAPKWRFSVLRMMNVTIGCFLGAAGSVLVWPRSTTAVLHDKAARQVSLAGEACESVLHTAAGAFSGRVQIQLLSKSLLHSPRSSMWNRRQAQVEAPSDNSKQSVTIADAQIEALSKASTQSAMTTDVTLEKYEMAIEDWKASKALFPLLRFDPFNFGTPNEAAAAFHKEISMTMSRALRIQTTVLTLDGMIRNDTAHDGFDENDFVAFAETGTLIRELQKLPLEAARCDYAAEHLFCQLEQIRRSIPRVSAVVFAENLSKSGSLLKPILEEGIMDFRSSLNKRGYMSTRMDDDDGHGMPKYAATSSNNNVMLFLQLV